MIARRLLTAIALLLSGCAGGAGQGSYPSLARRAVENAPVAAPAAAPLPVAADPSLDAEVARHLAQAEAGGNAFDKGYAAAERAARAASAAAVSSEPWIAAQLAISGLESARNDSVSALASLDTLYVQRENAIASGDARGGVEAIEAARTRALAIVDGQNDRIDALKGRLRQP
ncbi:MAG: hypothetical protein ABW164_02710 [Sphingobium sp.]